MKNYNIAVLPGDGIGPEIMKQAIKVLDIIQKKCNFKFNYNYYDVGGIAIDNHGIALPQSTILGCENSDAILFGSVGGDKWQNLPPEQQPERASLLKLRQHFSLFCNLRASVIYKGLEHLSPLKMDIIKDNFDILCVRELTGGIYFGEKAQYTDENGEDVAYDTEKYSAKEIERIAHIAFQIAQKRKNKLTSVDKANVLASSMLWRKIVNSTAKQYPSVTVEHMYIDNAAMQLIKNPSSFDVLLCSNLFGDILSDECAIITGSMGMLPSASLNEKNFGLYEPAGGSAPDIADQNIANPVAQILSAGLMLKYSFNEIKAANLIEQAVQKTLLHGFVTKDLIANKTDKYLSTEEMGDKIITFIE